MPHSGKSACPVRRNRGGVLAAVARLLVPIASLLASPPTFAGDTSQQTASLCDQAAISAARLTGVPVDVLLAITRTETGRQTSDGISPWPWTVNMEGRGQWFDTRDAALAHIFEHFKRGARSFDVGCFQINYKWHGAAFASIADMFDPNANARYAAEFLSRLYAETGDWTSAAGAYHSRTPEFADRYEARFERILGETDPTVPAALPRARFGPPRAIALQAPLANGPLIALSDRPATSAVLGSLMPPPESLAQLPAALVLLD